MYIHIYKYILPLSILSYISYKLNTLRILERKNIQIELIEWIFIFKTWLINLIWFSNKNYSSEEYSSLRYYHEITNSMDRLITFEAIQAPNSMGPISNRSPPSLPPSPTPENRCMRLWAFRLFTKLKIVSWEYWDIYIYIYMRYIKDKIRQN